MPTALKLLTAGIAIFVILLAGLVADANVRIAGEETLALDFGAPGRFVTVDGRSLHVATVGDVAADATGAPLLLVHGFAAPGHVTFLPWASKLGAKRALIMPDLLGYGHSAHIPVPGNYYSLKNQAAALAAILDDLGVARVDVVGHSYGGAVAAQFALDYPARVRRIVFMDAAIYVPRSHGEDIIALPLGIGRAVAWHAFGGGPFGLIAQYCRDQPNCRWMRLAHVRDTTDTLRAMMATHRDSPDGATLATDISKIAAPSLVIWGGDDRIVPVADGDRLARALKTNIAIIAGARHMPYLREPDKVAQRILDFLQPR